MSNCRECMNYGTWCVKKLEALIISTPIQHTGQSIIDPCPEFDERPKPKLKLETKVIKETKKPVKKINKKRK